MSQYDSIEQKASYGIGRNMGDQLAQQAFAGLDIPALQQGLADALNGLEFAVSRDDINDAFQVITARMQEEQEAAAKAAAAEGEAFLADNAKRVRARALPRYLHPRWRVRQLRCARPTGRVPGDRRDRRLGGSAADDAGWLQVEALHSAGSGLRCPRRRLHPAVLRSGIRSGAAGHPVIRLV